MLKFTLLLKKTFFHFFFEIFFDKSSYCNWDRKSGLFQFFLKKVFTIGGGQFFFGFSKQKIQIEHPYEGGGEKSIFENTTLGLLVVRKKVTF